MQDELPQFSHKQVLRVLSGILLCIFLAAIDQTVVIPAVPAIAADLNGFGHLAWIVSAYLLTSTAMTPIYGKLSDIYGRRKLLLAGVRLWHPVPNSRSQPKARLKPPPARNRRWARRMRSLRFEESALRRELQCKKKTPARPWFRGVSLSL